VLAVAGLTVNAAAVSPTRAQQMAQLRAMVASIEVRSIGPTSGQATPLDVPTMATDLAAASSVYWTHGMLLPMKASSRVARTGSPLTAMIWVGAPVGAVNATTPIADVIPAGNNTGVADTSPVREGVSPDVATRMSPKLAALRIYRARLASGFLTSNTGSQASPFTCSSQGCPDYGSAIASPLYYEGQGSTMWGKEPTWTCGPAATRNMTWVMAGFDAGEDTISRWEGTTTNGTSLAAIRDTLNKYYAAWGGWAISTPSSGSDVLAYVETDVNQSYKQPIIQNVLTTYLPFFNGAAYRHFDLADGYKVSTGQVTVGEEWNHTYGGVQPYGYHTIGDSVDYNAVHASPTHQLVW